MISKGVSEQENAGPERRFDFSRCFSHARKHHPRSGAAASPQHALEFAPRNHVKSTTQFSEQAQNALIGVGFYRIADRVFHLAECVLEAADPFPNGGRRIDVQRRSEFLGKSRKRNFVRVERGRSELLREVTEARRALEGFLHVRAEVLPFTLIATTVWSSKASTPRA